MTSNNSSEVEECIKVEVLYEKSIASSSSEEEIQCWDLTSLPSSEMTNPKLALYEQGLYDPGSGEICAMYVPISDSTVIRHLYYAYPCVKDPGIREALFDPEPQKIYPVDGQELYLNLCEEMKVIPVRSFHRGLLGKVIDLKYYGVNPNGVRAMSIALSYNHTVTRLDLTSNFLNEDACYHLGQMLGSNFALEELILSGCRICAEGVKRLVACLASRTLRELDLSRNVFGDSGFKHIADQLMKGAVIKRLNLSYNELTSVTASTFATAIEGNQTITHLDLSWNKMFSIKEVDKLLEELGRSKVLIELNLSWNNLDTTEVLRKLLRVPTLRILDLSNNRLGEVAVTAIARNLRFAKSLHTLDLSYNPLSADDAFLLVNMLRNKTVKLINLFMDNITVNKEFLKEYKAVMQLTFRTNCKIIYGYVKQNYTISVADMRVIILKRMHYLTSHASKKRRRTDIALYFMQKQKMGEVVTLRVIMYDMKLAGTPLDEELVQSLISAFPGPKLKKIGTSLNLDGVVDMIHRLWPEKKLPPTPEEEPELRQEPKLPEIKKNKKNIDKKTIKKSNC